VVKPVGDLTQHVANVANVVLVVLTRHIRVRHGTHVRVQPVDRAMDIVQHPAAEEPSDRNRDIE